MEQLINLADVKQDNGIPEPSPVRSGVANLGTIDTGAGDDIIIGTSTFNGSGIYNTGTILTGAGNDLVDAHKGGFRGDGNILLGEGCDIIKGFGNGSFNGGSGKDTLVQGISYKYCKTIHRKDGYSYGF